MKTKAMFANEKKTVIILSENLTNTTPHINHTILIQ